MQIKHENKIITTYIAEDGTSFTSMQECVDHEVCQLATFEQMAVTSKLVHYYTEDNSSPFPYIEDSDWMGHLKNYTSAVIWRTLGLVDKTDKVSRDKVNSYFGLE